MSEILYIYGGKLYANLTNRCPCRCSFCIRGQADGLGSAQSLWLEHDPSWEEIQKAFESYDLKKYGEVIFCGYGEPMCALDHLLKACQYLKGLPFPVKTRLNTNGLGDLIQGRPTAPLLKGWIDAVSISLNAPDAERFNTLCRPSFGTDAYEAMLHFAEECKEVIPKVQFSVVDVISPEEIDRCRKIAEGMGIPLRVRHFNEDLEGTATNSAK